MAAMIFALAALQAPDIGLRLDEPPPFEFPARYEDESLDPDDHEGSFELWLPLGRLSLGYAIEDLLDPFERSSREIELALSLFSPWTDGWSPTLELAMAWDSEWSWRATGGIVWQSGPWRLDGTVSLDGEVEALVSITWSWGGPAR